MLDFSRPRVMGILNVTSDSFFDGGRYLGLDKAVTRVEQMVAEGVDIVDVGGESTRPGATPVSVEQEIARVVPIIEAVRRVSDVAISVDTSKPEVMSAAVAAGASMLNDVRALQLPGALAMAAELNVPVCLMHMQGEPGTMQQRPHYYDVVGDVKAFLLARVDACCAAGIDRSRLLIDPGFGFGKTLPHNLALLKNLDSFAELGLPLLAGISRKSMIGAILGECPVEGRLYGSLAAALLALNKGAKVLRVHDVAPTVDVLKVFLATEMEESEVTSG